MDMECGRGCSMPLRTPVFHLYSRSRAYAADHRHHPQGAVRELDRVAAVLGHGLSPRKPGRDSLIRVTSPCPLGGVHSRWRPKISRQRSCRGSQITARALKGRRWARAKPATAEKPNSAALTANTAVKRGRSRCWNRARKLPLAPYPSSDADRHVGEVVPLDDREEPQFATVHGVCCGP